MIAVVGSRDIRIGFGLAGVKNSYKTMRDVSGEKIILLEKEDDSAILPTDAAQIVIPFSLQKKSRKINERFIKQVIGATVLVK